MPNTITPTPAQRDFIQAVDTSILLRACVGTGKTFALAKRAAEAIRRGVPPERILCVTFTNRAAEEMRQRIAEYCPQDSHKVVTRTFHSLCAWILRLGARQLGIPQDFSIIDEDDAQEIIASLKLPALAAARTSDIYYILQDYKICGRVRRWGDCPVLSRDTVERLHALYQRELAAYKGLDFGDLIALTNHAFAPGGPLAAEWSERFALVQVDEMQDTTWEEYQVVAHLARKAQHLVLAGDFDQTIYEWRGSTPEVVLEQFARDFPGYRTISFEENHRATQTLVQAAGAVVARLSRTKPRPAKAAVQGAPIVIHGAASEFAEARWIAGQIQDLHRQRVPYNRMGVICRSNKRAAVVSQILTEQQVPHITVETYEFFRRQEVKDSLAYLRVLLNPDDSISVRRVLRRPARGIGERTRERIEEMESFGLRTADLLSLATLQAGDPFAHLLAAYERGTLIVFDCETTGIDPLQDEIIELAAYKIQQGRIADTFHKYLKPTKSVGRSVHVHGLSDAFLAKHGRDPRAVLHEFAEFIDGGLLVGHNVLFDIRMLENACSRSGIPFTRHTWADTLTIARRFLATNTCSLGELAAQLNLSEKPTHRAIDDVAATWELLQHLIPRIQHGLLRRRNMIQAVGHLFWPLAEQFARWRGLMAQLRPPGLLQVLLDESGLLAHYRREPRRLENIQELLRTAEEFDDPQQPPLAALEALVSFAALSRNVDRIDRKDRVAVITVHQAKGLEFDVVFMPGVVQYEFPNYGAVKAGREREELRIFYVGITRAKRQLYLSYHDFTASGTSRSPSHYLSLIPKELVEWRGWRHGYSTPRL